jgi:hypothetical protein
MIKNNFIDNAKEIEEIPKALKESRATRKIQKEKLDDVVDRPKRISKKRDILDL